MVRKICKVVIILVGIIWLGKNFYHTINLSESEKTTAMILSSEYDINKMINYSLQHYMNQLNVYFQKHGKNCQLEIKNINEKKDEKDGIAIIVYYENTEGGYNLRNLVKTKLSKGFIDFEQKNQKIKDQKPAHLIDFGKIREIKIHNTFSKDDYIKMKKKIKIGYPFEEVKLLISFSQPARTITSLTKINALKFRESSKKIAAAEKINKRIKANRFLTYEPFFSQRHSTYVTWYNFQQNMIIIIHIVILPFLLFHLFVSLSKKDLNTILKDQLYALGVNANLFAIWKFKIKNFHLLILPTGKINKKVTIFCQKIKDDKDDKYLKKAGKEYFEKLIVTLNREKPSDFGHWENLYKTAMGEKDKNIQARQSALAQLISRVHYLSNKAKINKGKINNNHSINPKKDKSKYEYKQSLIDCLNSLLESYDITENFTSCGTSELEKLVRILSVLSKIPDTIPIFMIKKEKLMQKGSLFLKAISSSNRKIIKEELGLLLRKKEKALTKKELQDHSKILKGKKVCIIGGKKHTGRIPKNFTQAMKELGANAEFISSTDSNIDSVTDKEGIDIYLLLVAGMDHKKYKKLRDARKNLILFTLNATNVVRIKTEVIRLIK